MMLHETPLLRTLFACGTLQELPEGELESLLEEHPYFAHARWFQAARNLTAESALNARHQASVYCYDPLKYSWVLDQLHAAAAAESGIKAEALVEPSASEGSLSSEEPDLKDRSAESYQDRSENPESGEDRAGSQAELTDSGSVQEGSFVPRQAEPSSPELKVDSTSLSQDILSEATFVSEDTAIDALQELEPEEYRLQEPAADVPDPIASSEELQNAPEPQNNAFLQHPEEEVSLEFVAEVPESEAAVEPDIKSSLNEPSPEASADPAVEIPVSETAEAQVEGSMKEASPDQSEQAAEAEQSASDTGTSDIEQASRSEAAAENREPVPVFQPLFTQDYFAFTGTRVPLELPNDKPPTMAQLRSFTDWLRSMKRLAGATDPDLLHDPAAKTGRLDPGQHELIEKAEQSNHIGQEVLTEAMAEVRLSQGQREKALEIYEKLGLLYPEKKSYFAQKIEQILNSQ